MDKRYNHQLVEEKIYKMWEKSGCFTPKVDTKKKPFCIIMPPPNANAPLHIGHVMFVTLEDIMTRYHRMRGDACLWLPGADHAGILTQVVFEKKLAEKGKTRYDLGREEFYRQCYQFTQKNKQTMYSQIKALGASCDWKREKFTLDPEISKTVLETFVRLYQDSLVYRSERLINWCPRCSTALSNLEVIYKERQDPLYFIKYGPFVLATTRPETKFGDTAVAVHPKDKRYQEYIGKEVEVEGLIGKFKMKVIADESVDPEFGTGVVKVTPAHDYNDFEIGQKHGLEIKRVIDFDLKLNEKTGSYQGLDIFEARKKVAQDLKKKGLLVKVDKNYLHSVGICERCKTQIEPLVSLQWFIKTKPLAQKAIEAVKEGKIKILPKRFEKNYFQWMENIRDWCVSRQLWWGHQLPVYYCGTKGLSPLQRKLNPELLAKLKIKNKKFKNLEEDCGQTIISVERPERCPKCGSKNIIQDPDTLDTWFSSAQWPYTTLGFRWKLKSHGRQSTVDSRQNKISDFDYFYPTSVMETGYEILFFWVARMIMMGLYSTKKAPFKTVYLHGLVRDAFGEKMSKSKDNVIDPLEVSQKYGADAVRFSLIWGTASGNDLHLGEERIKGMRNFSNKIWNIGRLIKIKNEKLKIKNTNQKLKSLKKENLTEEDKKILKDLKTLAKKTTNLLEKYRFDLAADGLYHFLWHRFADEYTEHAKTRLNKPVLRRYFSSEPRMRGESRNTTNNSSRQARTIESSAEVALSVLNHVYLTCIKLLHPFMPFITEEIWQRFSKGQSLKTKRTVLEEKLLIISPWPKPEN